MAASSNIRLLPIHVANKIAAGEVVERPAAVVKELMENSLDAGAQRVEVEVTAGGRRLIAVADDGCGMGRDDALMCIEPQATSKIRDVDDIERINTYGFRGEAIPSIAAVARFTLKTRRQDESVGSEIVIAGGKLQDVSDIGFPQGTTVEVRDLFFNVPARRKFLRTYQTEQAHIRTAFILQALAHPDTAMRLKADGRDLHNLPGGSTLEERIRDLFGEEFLMGLRPIGHRQQGVAISGFAGLPIFTRTDRSEQYIFVNRRAASAAIIAYALREAYPPLEGNRKPIVLLFIEVAPEALDVNVHPTKREVRFREVGAVRDAIIAAVSTALGTTRRATQAADDIPSPDPLATAVPPPAPMPRLSIFPPSASGFGQASQPRYEGMPGVTIPTGAPGAAADPETEPTNLAGNVIDASAEAPWRWCRILGQINSLYLLLETDGGYVVLDPRAAHERVIYERLLAPIRENAPVSSQRLLLPETVQLPPEDATRLRKHLELLRSLGIEIDDFGDNRFIIEALPTCLATSDTRRLLTTISHDISAAGARRGSEKWRHEAVARAACGVATRTSGALKPAEMTALVSDLAAATMPYTCPRGRPTMIFTPLRELERKFGRAPKRV